MRSIIVLVITVLVLVKGLPGQEHADQVKESDVKSQDLEKPWTDFWLIRLIMNLFGYATVIVPGFIIIVYVRMSNYLDKPGKFV